MKPILKTPASVLKYMRSTREENDLDVALYINRAVEAYHAASERRHMALSTYIAIKLRCTPLQAGRAITWAKERAAQ